MVENSALATASLEGFNRLALALTGGPSVVTWCSYPCLVVSAEKVGSVRSGNSANSLRKVSAPDSEPDSPSYAALPSVHTREENVKASTKRLFLTSTRSP